MLHYHTRKELHDIATTLLSGNEDAAILVRMVDTYDPARQAVVTAAIKGENPVSIKMKLERPIVSDEPSGIH